jgi:Domain of unknown function (DUF5107)
MLLSLNRTDRIHDLHVVILENDWLRASVLPGVGAKIYDLIWKATGRNLLWHNPRILPQSYPVDGNFDNYWCGGWDEGSRPVIHANIAGSHIQASVNCGR